MTEWLSTKRAMEILGVGSTTIKRWADEGLLPFMRTAGGHRRFNHVELLTFLETRAASSKEPEEVHQWLNWLLNEDINFIFRQIQQSRVSLGDWFETCDFLGDVLRTIGGKWTAGEWSILQEHIASTKLGQVLDAIAVSEPLKQPVASCLLATLHGEQHDHGIVMSQLCLRSVGIEGINVGPGVSPGLLKEHIAESSHQIVALSASACQSDTLALTRACQDIADTCRMQDIILFLGGQGAWPEDRYYGIRCKSFSVFRRELALLGLTTSNMETGM